MRLLLDTHAWIWWSDGSKKLGPRARAAISNAAEVHLSIASAWEIVIKQSTGRLQLPPRYDYGAGLALEQFVLLPVDLRHVARVSTFPRIHRDPFDRMIVAQALEEGLTLVTADVVLAKYGVEVLTASD